MTPNDNSLYCSSISDATLRQLECFVVVAEEQVFVRASHRLGMAQPSVSRLIHRLERRVGSALFERTSRGVQLTAVARAMLPHARRTLAEARRAGEAAARSAAGEVGSLTIGFSASAALSVLPDLLKRFRTRSPDVHVTLLERVTAEQLAELERGLLDIAIVRGPITAPALTAHRILEEPFVAVLPAGHPLAAARSLSLATTARERFILFPRHVAPAFHDHIMDACRSAGFSPDVAEEAAEWHTIVGLVGAGLGVAIAPAFVQHLEWPTVVFRPLEGCPARAQLIVASRAGDLSPLVRTFLESARAMEPRGEIGCPP